MVRVWNSRHLLAVITGRYDNTGLHIAKAYQLSFIVMHGPGDPRVGPVYLRVKQLLYYVDQLTRL